MDAQNRELNPDPGAERDACHEAALRLLDRRIHSRVELKRKLLGRGFTAATVGGELDELERLRLLDDAEFAKNFTAEKMSGSSAWGAAKTRLELRRRGVAEDQVRELFDGISGEDEAAAAREALRRRWPRLRAAAGDPRAARLKACRFLASRGFSAMAAQRALELLERED